MLLQHYKLEEVLPLQGISWAGFSLRNRTELFWVAQTRRKREKEMSDVKPKIEGARKYHRPAGILSPEHMYIDTCASYASTPYAHLLTNLTKQARGLVGHSNAGLCSMSSSGEIGALKKVWPNKGCVTTILPLNELEKLEMPWWCFCLAH
jgi:hypothetical protein